LHPWGVVTASSKMPSHVLYMPIGQTGHITTKKPTPVAPADGRTYLWAQVVGTAKGASVFFAPSGGGTTAQLYRVDVDTNAQVVNAAAPVAFVIVADQPKSYEVTLSGGVIGVVWYGRTDTSDTISTGIYETTLTP
jgi:hypothetical protein